MEKKSKPKKSKKISLPSPEVNLNSPVFGSLLEVCSHLERTGFRISKSKLYRDRDKGMIRVNPDGTVPETEVRAYAATLDRIEGNIDDMSDVMARKALKELELRDEQVKKLKFARKIEEGKYMPRQDFESELASRAVVLDAGLRHMIQMRAAEWVVAVGGKTSMIPDFIRLVNEDLNRLMNDYSTLDNFQVMFQQVEEPETEPEAVKTT